MENIIDYQLVECGDVKEYIDKGWQPWGSAVSDWSGGGQRPHQPMVKYESPRKIYKRR